jgi:hypothetical protein
VLLPILIDDQGTLSAHILCFVVAVLFLAFDVVVWYLCDDIKLSVLIPFNLTRSVEGSSKSDGKYDFLASTVGYRKLPRKFGIAQRCLALFAIRVLSLNSARDCTMRATIRAGFSLQESLNYHCLEL